MSGQQHAPAALYPRERPGTHCTGGWVGPRAGVERWKISSPPGFDPWPSRPYSVAIPNELHGLHIQTILLINAILSSQNKVIHLLSAYTITACWEQGTEHVEGSAVTSLLTPWCRVLLEQLTSLQLVKKSPVFHGTRRFITALTSVCHLSLSWAGPIQSI